jgi:hypothetical protein
MLRERAVLAHHPSHTAGAGANACKRAPLGQLGDRDNRLSGHQFQRLAAQQSRDNRHLALNRKALGAIIHRAIRPRIEMVKKCFVEWRTNWPTRLWTLDYETLSSCK